MTCFPDFKDDAPLRNLSAISKMKDSFLGLLLSKYLIILVGLSEKVPNIIKRKSIEKEPEANVARVFTL